MLTNHTACKYETPYTSPFVITWYLTNGTVNIQYDAIQIRHNIHLIKPYINLIQMLKILNLKICVITSTYDQQLYTSVLY